MFWDLAIAAVTSVWLRRHTDVTGLHGHIAVAVLFLAVFAAIRALPELSYQRLLEEEKKLLNAVKGSVQHQWHTFAGKSLPRRGGPHRVVWNIHSLALRNPDGSGRRPVAILLHGHSSGSALWESVLDQVSQVADLLVLDLPGWGRSPAPPELLAAKEPSRVTELHTDMLEGWLQANGLQNEHIILIGHSFGGYLATQFAALHPHSIKQLILISPAGLTPVLPQGAFVWGTYFKFWPPQRIARVLGRIGYLLFTTIYGLTTTEDPRYPTYYYQLAAATTHTGEGDRPAATFLRYTWDGSLWWSTPCLTQVLEYPGKLSMVWGQQDELLPAMLGALVHRLRPETDLYYIKGALHNPAHSNSRATCDAIIDCILKGSGERRVTVLGRGSGRGYEGGDADKLLAITAHVSSGPLHSSAPPTPQLSGEITTDVPVSLPALSLPSPVDEGALPLVQPSSTRSGVSSSFTDGSSSFTASSLGERSDDLGSPLAVPLTPAAVPPASQVARGKDRVGYELGTGRGHCNHCMHAVRLHKSYWRCSCAAWSFNAHVSSMRTRSHFQAMLAFLDECFVYGTFNAQTSKCVVMYIRPKTPLPLAPARSSSDRVHGSGVRGEAVPGSRALRGAMSALYDATATLALAAHSIMARESVSDVDNPIVVVEDDSKGSRAHVEAGGLVGAHTGGGEEQQGACIGRAQEMENSSASGRITRRVSVMDFQEETDKRTSEHSPTNRHQYTEHPSTRISKDGQVVLEATPAIFARGEVFLLD